jgi:predicted 2-oxoglutarate/Fe(II)-dependent dioxygenase YbiX
MTVRYYEPEIAFNVFYIGCDITWQVMLTDMNEYTGGGTYFRCNRKTIKLRLGQVLVHPGELYHKGVDITSGIRELLICFLDGFDPQIIDKSDPKNDRVEYEKNVIVC